MKENNPYKLTKNSLLYRRHCAIEKT